MFGFFGFMAGVVLLTVVFVYHEEIARFTWKGAFLLFLAILGFTVVHDSWHILGERQ